MKKLCDLIARWMGAIVLLTAIFATLFPELLLPIGMWVVSPMLGLIMFGMGLTLKPSDFRVVFSRPRDVILGCVAQFGIMPLLAWLLVRAFSLPDGLAVGVILAGCCPGGTASNVITYLADGDLALSVGITAMSTVFAPLLTPILVWFFAGTFVEVDALGMLLSIIYVVIAPIICGFLMQKLFPLITQRAIAYLPAFSTLMIAAVVAMVVSHTASSLLQGGLIVILVVVLHNLLGLTAGYTVARITRMAHPKRVALSIEVGMQNSGLASALAAAHFASFPLAAVPGAVFSVWHNISGTLAARFFSHKR